MGRQGYTGSRGAGLVTRSCERSDQAGDREPTIVRDHDRAFAQPDIDLPHAVDRERVANVLDARRARHAFDFLAYVERRVHDRALAEEIVQDALVRNLDKSCTRRSANA